MKDLNNPSNPICVEEHQNKKEEVSIGKERRAPHSNTHSGG